MGMQGGEMPLSNPELRYTPNEYIINSDGSISAYNGAGVTDYYPATGGDVVVYLNPVSSLPIVSNGQLGKICVYDSSKTKIDYWNCRVNGNQGSFTVKSSAGNGYIRINIDMDNIAGSYAYNATTGVIYYAGKDTPYYGKTNIND